MEQDQGLVEIMFLKRFVIYKMHFLFGQDIF